MESNAKYRKYKSLRRAIRVRKHVRGTSEKPRLSVVKSNKHIFAQLIDDEKGITLASMGTMSKEVQGSEHAKKSKDAAKMIGMKIAQKAMEKQITHVVFDRGPFKYHGIIAELASAAREAGLQF
ncbi:MAG: 50S ribosomal protein L18 [Chlamydiae bacterium]|jgi:large subunit ribosomal protein L18|nr:50S ribosomal protein L18 [Chlamydiota bacterium]